MQEPIISSAHSISLPEIYRGDILFLTTLTENIELADYALSIFQRKFKFDPIENPLPKNLSKRKFVENAEGVKKEFTNSDFSHQLVRKIIERRYSDYLESKIFFDRPRVRIIPNSKYISSGVSYNYKPHRDTWYGAVQSQVNHWMPVCNVSALSALFLFPSYFSKPVKNHSYRFDLAEWDKVHRPAAAKNIRGENRPHPDPVDILDEHSRLKVVPVPGSDIAFSGQHLHGSAPNSSDFIRVSIDFRVVVNHHEHQPPSNIDSQATGDYISTLEPFIVG